MDKRIMKLLDSADAVVIGAGAGLSAAAGITYSGERFEKYFGDYIEHYGMRDMYSAGFYPFETPEEKWGYWSHHIYQNRYAIGATKLYQDIHDTLKDKAYFVLTTNVDHQFELSGFDKDRIFATQGDYGLFQCSVPCHDALYDNESIVLEMLAEQEALKIPEKLLPKCPKCGENLTMHLRADNTFVQNKDWDKAHEKYQKFIKKYKNQRIIFLELGVGMNTPSIIKYPFWQMTHQFKNAFYISINRDEARAPEEIKDKALCFNKDISEMFMH